MAANVTSPAATMGPPQASGPAPSGLAADEQRCPQCREIIKSGALKCRFCGSVLNSQLAAQDIPLNVKDDIDKQASSALWCGIIGLFICGPILGTLAITNANKALRALDQYPQYDGPRGKARAGQILGIVGWVLLIIFLLGKLASAAN